MVKNKKKIYTIQIIIINQFLPHRTVLPEVGLKMFLQSEDALPAMILPTVVGPICKKCERKTAFICDSETELCERCYHGHQLLNSAKAQPRYFYFDEEQKRDSLTLVFTCKRHSGGIKNVSTEADIFQELEDSFIKSQRYGIFCLMAVRERAFRWSCGKNEIYNFFFVFLEVMAHLVK
jgi:hypothetical protein